MQNRYAGDIGDYAKYGLLRGLHSPYDNEVEFSLGLVWYLNPDEEANSDGSVVRYLQPTDKNRRMFRACDPDVYDLLQQMVSWGQRSLKWIQKAGVLPQGTQFFDVPLSYRNLIGSDSSIRETRLDHRLMWLEGALFEVQGCDLVCLAPDNGLEVSSTRIHHLRAPKYCFYSELERFVARGQSVLVYQHIAHHQTADLQLKNRLQQIREIQNSPMIPFALRYHSGPPRAFLVLPAKAHKKLIEGKVERFLQGPWGQPGHFSLVRI